MTKIVLSKDEASFLKGLPKIYYMPIIKQKVDDWVSSTNNSNIGWIEVLNNLNEILRDSQNDVEQLLDERLATGKIKDKSQTRKSIVGNAFSNIIGQTYKWKLLMEIAMSDCEVRDKYEISYAPPTVPLVCFVTVNFYNEINNPQHRGMFKFFDRAFIGKPIDPQATDFISPLSSLIDFANENLVQSG